MVTFEIRRAGCVVFRHGDESRESGLELYGAFHRHRESVPPRIDIPDHLFGFDLDVEATLMQVRSQRWRIKNSLGKILQLSQ